MLKRHKRTRLYLVFLFVVFSLGFLILRLAYLQAFQNEFFVSFASRQHNFMVEEPPKRGVIFDRNKRELAINIELMSLYAVARDITDKEHVASKLEPILKVSRGFLLDRLNKDKAFVWIARKLSPDQVKQIKELNVRQLQFVRESRRSYPNKDLASHVIGFAGMDNKGLEGLELLYDDYLKGKPGWRLSKKDAKQRELAYAELDQLLPVDGYQLVLTIDEMIQAIAERELEKACKKYNAVGGSIIVMDPNTGDILAMANNPSYDLNEPGASPNDSRRNRAITDIFEPGSVFKVVTAAAALEEKLVNFDDKFYCENGIANFSGHILHDHTPHGTLSFKNVIAYSSNIGTVKVALKVGPKRLYKYITLFGFGKPTGIEILGEVSGMLSHPSKWSKFSISSIPIGQEVSVTAIQLAQAMSAVSNGGILMKPRLVKEIRDSKGVLIKSFEPTMKWRVVSQETSDKLKILLNGVVELGTGKAADIKEYRSGGKTGTAQKVEPNGLYSHSKFIASFVGFAPLNDPKIVIVVSIDEPRPYYYGGTVAAPVFKSVGCQTLRYLGVQPDCVLASEK